MAAELVHRYYAWADATEQKLFAYMDPNGGYKLHPKADYPLANFASVYAICVGYLLFVILGTAVMKAGVPALNTSALQFLYNPLQVIVCSYMCLEAAIQAYRNVCPTSFFPRSFYPLVGISVWTCVVAHSLCLCVIGLHGDAVQQV